MKDSDMGNIAGFIDEGIKIVAEVKGQLSKPNLTVKVKL